MRVLFLLNLGQNVSYTNIYLAGIQFFNEPKLFQDTLKS